jgi:putative endonuclease
MAKQFYVYILASKPNGTLYTGVTSNLIQRVWQHKHDVIQGFTRKYSVKTLVYYEVHENAESALTREKKIKRWRRAWKLGLIENSNPEWRDLYKDILG